MVIGRAGYVAGGIIMNQLKPRMLNADGWNWGESSPMFSSGVCKVIDAFTLQARKVVTSSLDSISPFLFTSTFTFPRLETVLRLRLNTCSRRRSPAGSSRDTKLIVSTLSPRSRKSR
jgi:hypothetical protein